MVTNAVELMAPQPAQLKGLAATSYIMYVLQACCLAAHLSLQASLGLLGAAGQLAAQAYTFARNEQKNSRAKAGTSHNALPPTAKSARRASTSAGHQPEACPTAQSGTGSLPGATKACPTAQSGTGSPSGTTGVRPAAQGGTAAAQGRLLTLYNLSNASATPDSAASCGDDDYGDDDYDGLYFDSVGNTVDEDGDILQYASDSDDEGDG